MTHASGLSDFQTVCRAADLLDGESCAVDVNGKLIAIFHEKGQFFAIDDVCPHMGAALSGGAVANGIVTCPWHAWRFRLCDGLWMNSPKVKIGSYPVRVENGSVLVQVPKKA